MEDRIEKLTIHTVVVGSGAAGLNGVHRLKQYGVEDLGLVTEDMNAGTSRNTGSDKQTYYKLSLAGKEADSVRRLAKVLYEGGCVDGDHALCEAALSCQGFFKLVDLGVPFPHDVYGEFVGYKTDHDPNNRGTSAGPYTSRYMTEALERAVRESQIPIYDQYQVIQILAQKGRLYGILCLDKARGRFVLIRCTNLVYATGGPGGMYKDSVYPVSQFGSSGLAFEAGVFGKNLTEWQYGLASLAPKWNVSGSYMQVLPRVVSTDQEGQDEREFLMEFYKSREEMMNMVFLKGYQWPFDARKVSGGSSMIDLLVYRETCVRRRRVWLDYGTNPGRKAVDFRAISREAREYLEKAGACQDTPYRRLCQLNEPAVLFYREHGVDLETQMLEVAVCAQHNNGGLSVNAWWQTNIEGLFAAGEAAGTHGIYRPGGSALNAGQAGSARAAEYIAAHKKEVRVWTHEEEEFFMRQAEKRAAMGQEMIKNPEDFGKRREEAVRQMSRVGAMLRDCDKMEQMIREIEEELDGIEDKGGKENLQAGLRQTSNPDKKTGSLSRFYRYFDMRICQKVYLEAMLDYWKQGAKSRGSAVYEEKENLSPEQTLIPGLTAFSLDGPEGRAHETLVQEIAYDASTRKCRAFWRNVRKLEDISDNEAFEVVWKRYRDKQNMD